MQISNHEAVLSLVLSHRNDTPAQYTLSRLVKDAEQKL